MPQPDRSRCRFCGGKTGTKEHLFPLWYSQYVNPERHPFFSDQNRKQAAATLNTVTRWICRDCNVKWLGQGLECETAPIVKRMIRADLRARSDGTPEYVALSAEDRHTLTKWAYKTMLVGSLMYRPPGPGQIGIREKWYREFRQTEKVPDEFSLVLGKYTRGPQAAHFLRVSSTPGPANPTGPYGICMTFLMRPLIFQLLRVDNPWAGAVPLVMPGFDLRKLTPAFDSHPQVLPDGLKDRFILLLPEVTGDNGFADHSVWPPAAGFSDDEYVRLAELIGQGGVTRG